jgi:hypothetical protein
MVVPLPIALAPGSSGSCVRSPDLEIVMAESWRPS